MAEQDQQDQVDFFVSYTKADEPWAEWIAWQLEAAQPSYRSVLQAWGFHAGGNFVQKMQEATTKARRTIAVLSPDFLQAKEFVKEGVNYPAVYVSHGLSENGTVTPDSAMEFPVVEVGSDGVIRGGSWFHVAGVARSANRYALDPSRRSYSLGFRLALSPLAK